MSEEYKKTISAWDPRTFKTSDLLAGFMSLRMHCQLDKMKDDHTNPIVQGKLKEFADEIDRRLPGP